MNIISIDVGMRHLAYCIISYTNLKITILKWEIIDLCSSLSNCRCHHTDCERRVHYYKHTQYYCKIHAKKQRYKIPPSKFAPKLIKKLTTVELRQISVINNYTLPKKCRKKDYLTALQLDLSSNYLNVIERLNSKTIDFITYGKRIKSAFNKIQSEFRIDRMLIENQIGPLALRMKMIQGMIIQHFIETNCPYIREISPTNKLREYIPSRKTTYSERKQIGISVMRNLLKTNDGIAVWSEYFEKHVKKDDLSDSFLQGLWYIKNI
jgi:hypothetical protein